MVLHIGAATIAAPTTQGPADLIGQGGGAPGEPQFSDPTNASFADEVDWNLRSA
jgi:hypothetical protein